MTQLRQMFIAILLTLCMAAVSYGGTITGSRTSATGARVGTITGSRTGTITGSRTGTITGSRTGTITGSNTGTLPIPNSGAGSIVDDQGSLLSRIMMLLLNLAW